MYKPFFLIAILVFVFFYACQPSNPNLDNQGQDELKSLEVDKPVNANTMPYQEDLYVPIYSDIYIDRTNPDALLAATLSIRNTSYEDTLYVSKIDYFNTEGDLVKSYLKNTIHLPPMGTVNYVIKREDDTGGAGANFMVSLSAKNKEIQPLIQAVMVGHFGNIGFSFVTDGYSIR